MEKYKAGLTLVLVFLVIVAVIGITLVFTSATIAGN